MKPVVLDIKSKKDRIFLAKLKRRKPQIVDEIGEQVKELGLVKNPKLLLSIGKVEPNKKYETMWIYYPWKNTLVHCLNEKDFKYLRTSRNQNLIAKDEQKKFEKFRVGIAGLNVGNPGALCLALEGDIEMKLADNDILSLSNLNRFRAGLPDLGLNKAILTARQIYEINPFARLEIFENGINDKNIEKFILEPRINILVEETDNLPLKLRIRELAKKNRVPVVMVTGSGPDVIIDVERFDKEPKLPLLSGYLKQDVIDGIKVGPVKVEEKIKLARDFMGVKYLHPRLVESFDLVGSRLAGIPQIAESSFLRGASIAYFVRQIAQENKVSSGRPACRSGRYYLKLTDVQRSKKS